LSGTVNFVLPSVQLARRAEKAEKFVNKLHVDLSCFMCFSVCYQFLVNVNLYKSNLDAFVAVQ